MPHVSYLSNYAGNAMLDFLLHNGGFLALHLEDPTPAGLLATEMAGDGYIRQVISFTAPSGKTAVSSNAQTFTGLPPADVPFLAVWDSISAGNMLFIIDLVALGFAAVHVTDQGQVLLAPGDIALSV